MNNDIAPILSQIDKLSSAYRERQVETYLSCFAEPALVYGTGADEKCAGFAEIRAHVERDWSQSSSASFTLLDPSVNVLGETAWVTADCRFDFRTEAGDGTARGRVTFVLEYDEGNWRIRHAHFSLPSPAAVGQSF